MYFLICMCMRVRARVCTCINNVELSAQAEPKSHNNIKMVKISVKMTSKLLKVHFSIMKEN